MAFALGSMGFLASVGIFRPAGICCGQVAEGAGYTLCEVVQDVRQLVSCALGALLCRMATKGAEAVEESWQDTHLRVCLL